MGNHAFSHGPEVCNRPCCNVWAISSERLDTASFLNSRNRWFLMVCSLRLRLEGDRAVRLSCDHQGHDFLFTFGERNFAPHVPTHPRTLHLESSQQVVDLGIIRPNLTLHAPGGRTCRESRRSRCARRCHKLPSERRRAPVRGNPRSAASRSAGPASHAGLGER